MFDSLRGVVLVAPSLGRFRIPETAGDQGLLGWPAPAGAWARSQAWTTVARSGGNRAPLPGTRIPGGRVNRVARTHVSWEAGGAAGFPSHLCPAVWAWSPGDIAGRNCDTARCTRPAFRPGSRRPGATGSGRPHSGGRSWRSCCSGRKNWSGCRRPGIAMDVAERIQGADVVVPGEPGTMIAPLPEVSRAPQHAVETPGTVPVEPMHEAWQIGR